MGGKAEGCMAMHAGGSRGGKHCAFGEAKVT